MNTITQEQARELLRALEETLAALLRVLTNACGNSVTYAEQHPDVVQARAAIAKARGGAQ